MTGLRDVALWSPDSPRLYTVRATIAHVTSPAHTAEVRTGFREALFDVNGFFLNGKRLEIFGLNRHQLFPYLGMAASARLQRRDAEIIKNELNCNMVRCSHYPQSRHFLDACDELGLMVWEEPPGWAYVGDAAFQKIVVQNVHDMVVRDRNRPSVIVWGTRLNETVSELDLYAQTRELAYQLDGTRQTTGAMASYSLIDWDEDVYGYDDYHFANGLATLEPPLPECPVAGQRVGRRARRDAALPVDRHRRGPGQPGSDARPGAPASPRPIAGTRACWAGAPSTTPPSTARTGSGPT